MPQFDLSQYIDVQHRITRFWEEYPDGAIRTQHASDPANFEVCRYRAEIYKHRDSATPDATGYAFEKAGSGMANKTAHEENCETSAIGRALANMGYATSGKDRPSRQEMAKASESRQTAPERTPSPPQGESPQSVRTAQQSADDPLEDHSANQQWQAASRTLHATAAGKVGQKQSHALTHLLALKAGVTSLKHLPTKRLLAMNDYLQSAKFETDYQNGIEAELAEIAMQQEAK